MLKNETKLKYHSHMIPASCSTSQSDHFHFVEFWAHTLRQSQTFGSKEGNLKSIDRLLVILLILGKC